MESLFTKTNSRLNRPSLVKPRPNIAHSIIIGALVTKPDRLRSLISFEVNFSQQDMELRARILFSMQTGPSTEVDLSPTRIAEGDVFCRFTPSFLLFKGEATPMYPRPSPACITWRRSIQHPVSSQACHFGAGHILQWSKETMIAILTVSYDDIQAFISVQYCSLLTEGLYLRYAQFDGSFIRFKPTTFNG